MPLTIKHLSLQCRDFKMKKMTKHILLSLLIAQSVVVSSFASEFAVIKTQDTPTVDIRVAGEDGSDNTSSMTESEKAELLEIEKSAKKTLFPFESSLTPGVVETHELTQKNAAQQPALFVIGDDYSSVVWLKKNKSMLEELHAVGMITNVKSQERVDAISEDTSWKPLIPVSMNGAEDIFKVEHVPFYVNHGVVSQ